MTTNITPGAEVIVLPKYSDHPGHPDARFGIVTSVPGDTPWIFVKLNSSETSLPFRAIQLINRPEPVPKYVPKDRDQRKCNIPNCEEGIMVYRGPVHMWVCLGGLGHYLWE